MSYLIDSDVLITAKNSYYAFDLCPGFWESLQTKHLEGSVFSLDRIRSELLQGRDDDSLVEWTNNVIPKSFFLSSATSEVANAFSEIMLWVQQNSQFQDTAKAKFATGADGWLVAFAKVNGWTVVTMEESRPESRNQVKLPDVCIRFGVPYQNVFSTLRQLNVQYRL